MTEKKLTRLSGPATRPTSGDDVTVVSLCSGYEGLTMGLGVTPDYVSEIDRDACTVLKARFPDTPNLGDLTLLDSLPDCDLLTAGFPCQPVSQAGARKGTDDDRWLWDDIERVVGGMDRPPRILFLENVRGLLSANGGDAMGRVVSGLARLGFVGSYRVVAASDVGACHRRERVFIVAWHAEGGRRDAAQPPDVVRRESPRQVGGSDSGDAADAEVDQQREPTEPRSIRAEPGDGASRFGPYWPAVARWERIVGRPAPDPTTADAEIERRPGQPGEPDEGRPLVGSVTSPSGRARPGHPSEGIRNVGGSAGVARLNPRFVEWMMGLPDGWVTNTGISRTAQLRILGNGVVPQQAAYAWQLLTDRRAVA